MNFLNYNVTTVTDYTTVYHNKLKKSINKEEKYEVFEVCTRTCVYVLW